MSDIQYTGPSKPAGLGENAEKYKEESLEVFGGRDVGLTSSFLKASEQPHCRLGAPDRHCLWQLQWRSGSTPRREASKAGRFYSVKSGVNSFVTD
ncbi:hypothetical protein WJX77_006070 [Trebouxia sp. C0004]